MEVEPGEILKQIRLLKTPDGIYVHTYTDNKTGVTGHLVYYVIGNRDKKYKYKYLYGAPEDRAKPEILWVDIPDKEQLKENREEAIRLFYEICLFKGGFIQAYQTALRAGALGLPEE